MNNSRFRLPKPVALDKHQARVTLTSSSEALSRTLHRFLSFGIKITEVLVLQP